MPRRPYETEQQYKDRKRREQATTTRTASSPYPSTTSGVYVEDHASYYSTGCGSSSDSSSDSSSSDSGCGE